VSRALTALAVLLHACGGTPGVDAAADEEVVVVDAGQEDRCLPDDVEPVSRGNLAPGSSLSGIHIEPCTLHLWSFAAPRGSEMRITVSPGSAPELSAAVAYPDDPTWSGAIEGTHLAAAGVAASSTFDAPRSGEFLLLVGATDPALPADYGLALDCASGCDLETTRFPVVLVHGWTGWESIGSYTYFHGIPELLAGRGYPVFVPELDPYNHVDVRSVQLASQIDDILLEARARKVDIVAHSQGGLDARRLISTLGYGDRVSALVTFSTPHRGTPIADIALGYLPGPTDEALYFLLELLGATVTGSESDARASFESMATDYVVGTFNPANPDDPRVSYVSWAGLTCLLGMSCGDVCDVEIRWSYDLIYLAAGDNDGIVPVSSAPWGDYGGTVPADHFDEVGQLMGVTGPNFDHEEFYLQVARDLASGGH
jgi:triacylglycerol esterase/lipase EstA (alpha/beta hydrolase family)